MTETGGITEHTGGGAVVTPMSAHAPLLFSAALLLAACAGERRAPRIESPTVEMPDLPPDTVDVQGVDRAVAEITPLDGSGVEGTVSFTRTGVGVRVLVYLTGLSQSDYHGFQVLRGRDCDADLAVQLGVETGAPHGSVYATPGDRRAGDLGNIRGDDGIGRYDRIEPLLTLDGTGSLVGRAVVVRERRDDGVSPDGNAGGVIGCGIAEAR